MDWTIAVNFVAGLLFSKALFKVTMSVFHAKVQCSTFDLNTLVLKHGLVVPELSTVVFHGPKPAEPVWPTNEEAAKAFKILFGLKKKAKVEEEEDKPVEKIEESESEEESEEEPSEDEEEIIDEDED